VFLSNLKIINFRCFGDGTNTFEICLKKGLTAIVGENDTGKTAVLDALRYALGTTDQDWRKVEDTDFHDENTLLQITIQCQFSLDEGEMGPFVEYLTYSKDASGIPSIYVNWTAKSTGEIRYGRPVRRVEVHSGRDGDGPSLAPEVRELLQVTYLKPLRDADQALAAGRGSRLSQVLASTKTVRDFGVNYDPEKETDPHTLSVRGIGDYANSLLEKHAGVGEARTGVDDHLKRFSLRGDHEKSTIRVGGMTTNPDVRLRQLLEKLDLSVAGKGKSGLGTSNTLFMACELLLLAQEGEVNKLLLIEEPEAHLHPQRQLRVMKALQDLAKEKNIQIIVTTHSPNLASAIDLDNIVVLRKSRPFSLARNFTMLSESDYSFLERFLDVTKANLFFARGVMIVEGDAENILIPTLAQILGLDFTTHGVSIVNVGGVGLSRYARIFQRKNPDEKEEQLFDIPVACVIDMDVMPNCAPTILGKSEDWSSQTGRRWKAKQDFGSEKSKADAALLKERQSKEAKITGQCVRAYVSDEWALEYDLALGTKNSSGEFSAGLAEDVFIAACLAENDDAIHSEKDPKTTDDVESSAKEHFAQLKLSATPLANCTAQEVLASTIYAKFARNNVSKPIAAQYLAQRLTTKWEKKEITAEFLRHALPSYITKAIEYVTYGVTPPSTKKVAADAE
jgi:putative ATP-dependent endonuclease of the OLD family